MLDEQLKQAHNEAERERVNLLIERHNTKQSICFCHTDRIITDERSYFKKMKQKQEGSFGHVTEFLNTIMYKIYELNKNKKSELEDKFFTYYQYILIPPEPLPSAKRHEMGYNPIISNSERYKKKEINQPQILMVRNREKLPRSNYKLIAMSVESQVHVTSRIYVPEGWYMCDDIDVKKWDFNNNPDGNVVRLYKRID